MSEVWMQECQYDGPDHVWPADWVFGGANGEDPRADPRWKPTTYEYFDARLQSIHLTQTPLCVDQAIDEFTVVGRYGPDFVPVYLAVKPPDAKEYMSTWRYDKATDTVKEHR